MTVVWVQKHEEMLDKMREVEAEYNKQKQPLYAARGKIIRRIPGFWLHCFLQHEEIKSILGTVDHDILVNLDEVCNLAPWKTNVLLLAAVDHFPPPRGRGKWLSIFAISNSLECGITELQWRHRDWLGK